MSALPLENETNPINEILTKGGDVAVLPQVVFKIMEMTGDDTSSAMALEKAIVVDPGFSIKLLAQANSAYYSLPKKVTSIKEAILFVGLKSVRQLAMAVGVFDMFVGKTDKDSLRRRGWWRNSLDAAVCSRELAAKFPSVSQDEAYTCGLLHLIGKTILDRYDPAKYEKVELLIQHGATDRQAEKAVYGCDHVEIAMASAKNWGFPDLLVAGLNYRDDECGLGTDRQIAALVSTAHAISKIAIDGGPDAAEGPDRIPGWAIEALGITQDQVDPLITTGVEAISNAARLGI